MPRTIAFCSSLMNGSKNLREVNSPGSIGINERSKLKRHVSKMRVTLIGEVTEISFALIDVVHLISIRHCSKSVREINLLFSSNATYVCFFLLEETRISSRRKIMKDGYYDNDY